MSEIVRLPQLGSRVHLPIKLSALLEVLQVVIDRDEVALTARLKLEPTLSLHAIYGWQGNDWPTVSELAVELVENPQRFLDWTDCEDHRPIDATDYEALRNNRIAVAREVLSKCEDQASGDQGYLAGLVCRPADWFSLVEAEAADLPECWLKDEHPLAELVREAEAGGGAASVEITDTTNLQTSLSRIGQLIVRNRALEESYDQQLLQEKLAAMSGLAYGASHEINNPLANISTRAQTLLREETDPEKRRKLSTINSQAFRAHEMISDMMLFAKPPTMRLAPCEVGSLIKTVISEVQADAKTQGTEILPLGIHDERFPIEADETQLAVAFKALMTNSMEALVSGGRIEVRLAWRRGPADDKQLSISVSDNGPGIPAEILSHLFDPFFSGREAGRGLGLGLSKCWRVVTEHQGTIEVDSNGHGTRFDLLLPASP